MDVKQMTKDELYAYQNAIKVELSQREQKSLIQILNENAAMYVDTNALYDEKNEMLYLPLSAKSENQYCLECLVIDKGNFLKCHDIPVGNIFRNSLYEGHIVWDNFYMDSIHISRLKECKKISREDFWEEVNMLILELYRLIEYTDTFNTWVRVTPNI